jgi:phosphoribosylformylglycinamidine cyclo-ligase
MTTDPSQRITYAAAGVDIDARDATARRFGAIARETHGPRVLRMGGGFAGLFHLGDAYRDPVLVGATDGVGTKVLIATAMDHYETMGQDVVHNNVNDLITTGAEPLFFLDYFATTDLSDENRVRVVEGIAEACRAMDVALIGGETADMPDVYRSGDFDLAGFVVGVVERDAIIDGSAIAPADALVALPSSGLHTNGYSLVREIWALGKGLGAEHDREVLETRHEELAGGTLGDALLAVHEPYWPLLREVRPRLKGLAHITGGGIPGNLPRILSESVAARIDRATWDVPPLFGLIQRTGGVDAAEMYRTFNMGVGMILVVAADDLDATLSALPGAWRIGAIEARADGGPVRGLPGSE